MTYALGKPFVVGRYKVAVVSRLGVVGRRIGCDAVAVACSKEPAFVVVEDGQGRVVLDMLGGKVPLAQVAALCPDVHTL